MSIQNFGWVAWDGQKVQLACSLVTSAIASPTPTGTHATTIWSDEPIGTSIAYPTTTAALSNQDLSSYSEALHGFQSDFAMATVVEGLEPLSASTAVYSQKTGITKPGANAKFNARLRPISSTVSATILPSFLSVSTSAVPSVLQTASSTPIDQSQGTQSFSVTKSSNTSTASSISPSQYVQVVGKGIGHKIPPTSTDGEIDPPKDEPQEAKPFEPWITNEDGTLLDETANATPLNGTHSDLLRRRHLDQVNLDVRADKGDAELRLPRVAVEALKELAANAQTPPNYSSFSKMKAMAQPEDKTRAEIIDPHEDEVDRMDVSSDQDVDTPYTSTRLANTNHGSYNKVVSFARANRLKEITSPFEQAWSLIVALNIILLLIAGPML